MALSLVTKTLKDGNGVNFTGQFATDGTNLWSLSVLANEQGAIITDSNGVPITATSLPLPNGAATSAGQSAINIDGGSQVHVTNFPVIAQATGQNSVSPTTELLVGGQFNTTPTTIASGNASPLQMDNAGNLLVNVKAGIAAGGTSSSFAAAFPSTGTAIGAKSGANMVNLVADASSNLFIANQATSTGGSTTFACIGISGAGTGPVLVATPQAIKASAGTLYRIRGYNANDAIVWIQLFDLAVGAVTPGTTVPKDTVPLLPLAGFDELLTADFGAAFATAITASCTTTATGPAAPSTGITCTFYFK